MVRHLLLFLALFGLVSLAAPPLAGADWERLGRVQKVYLWPMSDSLDQFLAEQVATEGVFDVVVDPKRAQAILTDRISSKFLEGMEELFPTPEEIAEADKGRGRRGRSGRSRGRLSRGPIASNGLRSNSASRAEGAVFLVDVRTREVLWSTFLERLRHDTEGHAPAGADGRDALEEAARGEFVLGIEALRRRTHSKPGKGSRSGMERFSALATSTSR